MDAVMNILAFQSHLSNTLKKFEGMFLCETFNFHIWKTLYNLLFRSQPCFFFSCFHPSFFLSQESTRLIYFHFSMLTSQRLYSFRLLINSCLPVHQQKYVYCFFKETMLKCLVYYNKDLNWVKLIL